MKRFSKSFIILCSLVLLMEFFGLALFTFVPIARAADPPASDSGVDLREIKLTVPIGDKGLGTVTEDTRTRDIVKPDGTKGTETYKVLVIPWLANYISNAYRYGVILGSILAVVMIMVGGVMYVTGGINASMISRAKEIIAGAVTGLLLLLSSYLILNIINPNLVKLKPIEVETIKAQALLDSQFCGDLDAASTMEVDASKVGNKGTSGAEWNTKPSCGEDFAVRLKAAEAAKGDSSAGNQTCKSDACPNPAEKCVNDFPDSPGWGCHNVLMYGGITIPDKLNLFMCNPKYVFGSSFFVTKVRVVAVNQGGFVSAIKLGDNSSTYWPVTEYKPVGEGKTAYSFAKSEMNNTFSGTSHDDWLVLLNFTINDASWVVLPTISDDVFAAPKNAGIGGKSTDVAIADTCWKSVPGAGWDTTVYDVQYLGGKPLYVEAPKITLGDLKAGTKAVKWNINITNDFFGCESGKATSVKGQINCSLALAGATGNYDRKEGDTCIRQADCKMGLDCAAGICSLKGKLGSACNSDNCGWTDCSCSTSKAVCTFGDLTTPAGSCNNGKDGTCDCKTSLYCISGRCLAAGVKLSDPCDPTKTDTCGNGLMCDSTNKKCVEAPIHCTSYSLDCTSTPPRWNAKDNISNVSTATCDGGYCKCNRDIDCSDHYRCATNSGPLFGGNKSCVSN